eukprot:NODE_27_length_39007_cov_1.590650.p15 type:complete len:300 gc:universal NODE_27_length_39007_cov_1.590650:9304-10203(+)
MFACEWEGCSVKENNSKSLYDHIQKAHIGFKRQGTLQSHCKWLTCDFTTERRDRMRSHVLCHIDAKLFECNLCHKSYKWKHDLGSHQRKVHGRDKSDRRKSSAESIDNTLSNYRRHSSTSLLDLEQMRLTVDQNNPESFCVESSSRGTSPGPSDHLSPGNIPIRRHSMQDTADLNGGIPMIYQRRVSDTDIPMTQGLMVAPNSAQQMMTTMSGQMVYPHSPIMESGQSPIHGVYMAPYQGYGFESNSNYQQSASAPPSLSPYQRSVTPEIQIQVNDQNLSNYGQNFGNGQPYYHVTTNV